MSGEFCPHCGEEVGPGDVVLHEGRLRVMHSECYAAVAGEATEENQD